MDFGVVLTPKSLLDETLWPCACVTTWGSGSVRFRGVLALGKISYTGENDELFLTSVALVLAGFSDPEAGGVDGSSVRRR